MRRYATWTVAWLACACGAAEVAQPDAPRPEEQEVREIAPRIAAAPAPAPAPRPDAPSAGAATVPGAAILAVSFGGSGLDQGVDVAVGPDGDLYVLGHFTDTVDFGTGEALVSAGLEDVFLLKLDAAGNPLWARAFGGTGHDYADDAAVDADGNVFIAGSFSERIEFGGAPLRCKGVHDVFLAKLDPDGEHLWSRSYGDAQDQICLKVEPDGKGGAFLAGYFRGAFDLGGRPMRSYPDKAAFVGRVDERGRRIWNEQFGHIYDFVQPGLALEPGGGIALTSGSDPTRELTGRTTPHAKREMDLGAIVARYDAGGKRLWRRRFGGGSDWLITRVGLFPNGDLAIGGSYSGELDFGGATYRATSLSELFLARLAADGGHVWSQRFKGGRSAYLVGLEVLGDGRVVLVGQYDGGPIDLGLGPLPIASTSAVFAAELDQNGAPLWSRAFDGPDIQFPGGTALDANGDVVIAGTFAGSIDFDGFSLTSRGDEDVFIVKIAP
jgi:hypothetical protein